MTEISYQGEYNRHVLKLLDLKRDILINDVTLREGEQAAEVNFNISDKLRIVEKLAEIGVQQIQCGYPGRSMIDRNTVVAIRESNIPIKVEVIAQAYMDDWQEQINTCIDCKPDKLDLMYPSSMYRLHYVQKITESEMLKKSVAAVRYAANRGVSIRFAPTDSCRTRLPFLLDVYAAVVDAGAEIVSLADTVGNMTPSAMKHLVQTILKHIDVPLQVHCHNDFGLALANTLAAFEAGASIFDASINGYGERAGNTSLDELAVSLRVFYDIDLGIDLSKMRELSRLAEKLTKIPIPVSKPLVGENAFAHKLDAHVMGVTENPIAYETISPELVGNVRQIPIGKYSGPFSIKKKGELLGLQIQDKNIEKIYQKILGISAETGFSIKDDTFIQIVNEIEN